MHLHLPAGKPFRPMMRNYRGAKEPKVNIREMKDKKQNKNKTKSNRLSEKSEERK